MNEICKLPFFIETPPPPPPSFFKVAGYIPNYY